MCFDTCSRRYFWEQVYLFPKIAYWSKKEKSRQNVANPRYTWKMIGTVMFVCLSYMSLNYPSRAVLIGRYFYSTCQSCMNVRDVDGKSVLDRLIAKMPDAAMVTLCLLSGLSLIHISEPTRPY